jgi:hypothetical protein
MPDQQPLSVPAAFFATLWGKILAVLAAITMVIGIYLEIISAWRGTNEAVTSSINVEIARAQATKAKAEAAVADDVAAGERAKARAASMPIDMDALNPSPTPKPSPPLPGALQGQDVPTADTKGCIVLGGQKICPGDLSLQGLQQYEAEKAFKSGDYNFAYTLEQIRAATVEADEIKEAGKAGEKTASALANLSWYGLFAQKYTEALTAANRSLALDPPNLVPVTNQAHALMFLGRTGEAELIYLAHKGEKMGDKPWEMVISEDFAELRKAGVTSPAMTEIEAALK